MSEIDEIENLFSDAFANEQVVPPKSVKQNIDNELFGSTGRLIWIFALMIIFLLPIGGVLYYSSINNSIEQIAVSSIVKNNELNDESIKHESQKQDATNLSLNTNTEDLKGSVTDEKSEILNASGKEELREQNIFQNKSSEKITSEVQGQDNSELNGTTTYDADKELNILAETASLEGSQESAQVSEGTSFPKEEIEISRSLLALSKVDGIEEKPLPYDLLLMCATSNYPQKQRLPISLDVYAGVEKGFNNYDYTVQTFVAMDKRLTEDLGTSVSLEVSYPLRNRISIASGFGVQRANNTFSSSSFGTDTTFVGDTMVVSWYFDTVTQMQTSDTTFVPVYDVFEFEGTESTFITRTSYFIPLYLKYQMPIGLKWSVGASAGVRFSYDHLKIGDNTLNMTVNEFKRFGISTVFRPQVNFAIGQWNIGAYGQTGFDLIHGLSGDATRVRRFSIGGGLNFRYTF
jgi:hypothetical protein